MHGPERGINETEQKLTSDVRRTDDVKPPREIGKPEEKHADVPKEIGESISTQDVPHEIGVPENGSVSESNNQQECTGNPNSSEKGEIPAPIEYYPCRNECLAGDVHPITGVPFERKVIEVDGRLIEGVFPVFESSMDVQLPESLYMSSDREQFAYCNTQLKEEIANNPGLREQFDDDTLQQILNGDTPDGFVWNHNEECGRMQLVDLETHQKTGHTGGKAIWGGGSENR